MDNIDGQRKLTSHDSSQNEQQDGANHGDDRERQSEETKTREGAQLAPEALRLTLHVFGIGSILLTATQRDTFH